MAAQGAKEKPGPQAWPTDLKEAARIQKELAGRVVSERLAGEPRTVAAVDSGFWGPPRRPTHMVTGVVLYRIADRTVLERRCAFGRVRVPYVPGYLSFREAPSVIEAVEKLSQRPDVFLIDGQGIAHPRFLGIAAHVGVVLDYPTIGCAKSRLVGQPAGELPPERGSHVDLVYGARVVGAVVRTRDRVKPLYVSIGNRITLAECIELVLALSPRYRLPEPARLAHRYVTELAKDPSIRRNTASL